MEISAAAERRLLASSLSVNSALTAAGGFLDGFTFFGHGRVFANAMTGNVIMLGHSVITYDWPGAWHRVLLLVAFSCGIWFSQLIHLQDRRRHRRLDPYSRILLLEVGVLLAFGFYPRQWHDTALIIAIAFASSAQVQTFREVRGKGYFSTFTTGNLRTLCEATFSWLFEERDAQTSMAMRTFAQICAVFLIGTVLGGLAFARFGNYALWFAALLLVYVAYRLQRGRASLDTRGAETA